MVPCPESQHCLVGYSSHAHYRIYTCTPRPLACVLCHKGMESLDHLFFSCSFSSFVWHEMLRRLSIHNPTSNWDSLVEWAAETWKRKSNSHLIAKMCPRTIIYCIWKERNLRTFKNEFKSKEGVLLHICIQMTSHIQVKWRNDPCLPRLIAKWA